MDIRTHALNEIDAINRTLANHGVDAGTAPGWTTIAGQAYIVYGLHLGNSTTISTIEKRLPELAEALSNLRRAATPVRLRTMPLALEVAHPQPAPLAWRRANLALPPATMLAGRNYGGASERETIAFDRSPHVLVAGLTGSGKSTLLLMLLLSLALNTDPAELAIHLVDLKNEDLLPLAALPHVRRVAVTPAQAVAVIQWFQLLKNERVAAGHGPYTRTLLAIDELAQVANLPGALDALGDVLSIGRSKNINVLAATQKPTTAVTGSLARANFAARLVGRVADAQEAATATGRRDTGAHLLPTHGGAFLRIEGAEPTRFQAYHLDADGVLVLVDQIVQKWGKAERPATVIDADEDATATARRLLAARGVRLAPPAAMAPDTIPPRVAALIAEYIETDGTLRRGGMAAMIRELFGPVAATGGRAYQEQCAEAQRYIELWQAQARKPSGGDKIVNLQEWKYRRKVFQEVSPEVKGNADEHRTL